MLINADLSSNKTDMLLKKYLKLLTLGVSSNDILVILSSPQKRNNFLTLVKKNLTVDFVEKLNIYTFNGLVYNCINDNYYFLENLLKTGDTKIKPHLSGLEISQFLLKDCIKAVGFKDYNSKVNLLHQLFRRHSLIVQNALTEQDVQERSLLLNETFAEDAQLAINLFKQKTNELRCYDYIRQISLFEVIYKKTEYFKNIKYLLIDDCDEFVQSFFNFVEYLKPQLLDYEIFFDEKGSSRCGFLSANSDTQKTLEKIFNTTSKKLVQNKIDIDAENIYENILKNKKIKLTHCEIFSGIKRIEMLEKTFEQINLLLQKGFQASDIGLVTPVFDNMLKFSVQNFCEENELLPVFLTGNEKLNQNILIQGILTVLKYIQKDSNTFVDIFEMRNLLNYFLKIPIKNCFNFIVNYKQENLLKPFDFGDAEYNLKYEKFLEVIQNLETQKNKKLSEKIITIFYSLLEFRSFDKEDFEKFNQLFKQVEDFEKVFANEANNLIFQKQLINQLENTIISENPIQNEIINFPKDSILVSSPQKIIDMGIRKKFLFLLDISNDNWNKQDVGTLYNAWAFQANWDKEIFDYEKNIFLTKQKTAKIIRKLKLSCEKFFIFFSIFDKNGNENFGGILESICIEEKNDLSKQKKFIPRQDQEKILDYKSGIMAIAAVPGAGKTTVLQALIMKLIETDKIKPENIFVLTYMDSAAKNFKERIKTSCPNLTTLPNISTIHGLALRIIKENGNYTKLNLNENFEILDELQKQRIVRLLLTKMNIKENMHENFEKALSIFKLSGHNIKKTTQKNIYIKQFLEFVENYNKILSTHNKIDYEDMLCYAVELLENYPDILKYYQNICHYVIEDEAQDSSALQQKLLHLLSSKYKNLIRCGDINQAITSTFSNADVEGFRNFMRTNFLIKMNCSQRCAKGIFELANKLIDYSCYDKVLKNAFEPIKMQEVKNKNPQSDIPFVAKIFDKQEEEKIFILNQIHDIFINSPNASIAVLLRNKYQVQDYIDFFALHNIKTDIYNDSLEQKKVFKLIFKIFKFIQTPFDNNLILELYQILDELGLIDKMQCLETYLKEECKTQSFISIDLSDLPFEFEQLWWDINYWLQQSFLPPDELAIKIGCYYFSSHTDISNIYLISTLLGKITENNLSFDNLLSRFTEIAKRNNFAGLSFYEEENTQDNSITKIKIMTIHKSKGDEFDFVFIPEMTEKSLPLTLENVKTRKDSIFIEEIKRFTPSYKAKNEIELKQEQIEETARLIYVALTRAKKTLFITCAKKYKVFNRLQDFTPSLFFEIAKFQQKGIKND